MRRTRRTAGTALLTAAVLVTTACGARSPDTAAPASGSSAASSTTAVTLQLQWSTQTQFAGYFAAVDQGYYTAEGLEVDIVEGGADVVPQTELDEGRADYAIAWVPKALASREQGAGVTAVGQVFQRSGTLQVSLKRRGITSPADLKGKRVGTWGFGNEFELFGGLTEAGLAPGADVTLVRQQYDMQALLAGEIDAAQAMTYNEYAQVLEAENPATGELYQPSDLTVLDWNDVGTAMLQDAVWANTDRLEGDEAYQQRTVRFLKASMKGWVFCRDHAEECRDIVVGKSATLGASHQLWQMNEVNKLIWPSPQGIGISTDDDWNRTVHVAQNARNAEGATLITRAPEGLARTNDYAQRALDELKAEGVDVSGETFRPITVSLKPGGA